MNRRALLTGSVAGIGSTVAGCLERGGIMDNSNGNTDQADTTATDLGDGDGSDEGTKTDTGSPDDHETDGQSTACEIQFEILNEWGDEEESVTVTFDEDSVTVTGIIRGRNGCYTARLDETVIEDDRLIVRIESYEDAEEDEACTGALVFIEYKATIKMRGELPASVRVEHNNEQVTTEQPS